MTDRTRARMGFSRGKPYFEKLVKEAVASLPPELRSRLENVAFIVEDEPPQPEDWEENGQELLGLYHGISQRDRGFWYGNVCAHISIESKPLKRTNRTVFIICLTVYCLIWFGDAATSLLVPSATRRHGSSQTMIFPFPLSPDPSFPRGHGPSIPLSRQVVQPSMLW